MWESRIQPWASQLRLGAWFQLSSVCVCVCVYLAKPMSRCKPSTSGTNQRKHWTTSLGFLIYYIFGSRYRILFIQCTLHQLLEATISIQIESKVLQTERDQEPNALRSCFYQMIASWQGTSYSPQHFAEIGKSCTSELVQGRCDLGNRGTSIGSYSILPLNPLHYFSSPPSPVLAFGAWNTKAPWV